MPNACAAVTHGEGRTGTDYAREYGYVSSYPPSWNRTVLGPGANLKIYVADRLVAAIVLNEVVT